MARTTFDPTERRIAGLRVRRVPPSKPLVEDPWHRSQCLPELEPPSEDRLRSLKDQIFASDRILLSHASAIEDNFVPDRRPERHDATARATVYVMNLIVVTMSLPVGMALLMFNIIGGENLRTTAHVVALTGLGMALASSPGAPALLATLV